MIMQQRAGLALLFCVLLSLSLCGCGAAGREPVQALSDTQPGEDSAERRADAAPAGGWNCAWYVYWDPDVEAEFSTLEEDTDSFCMFSCYFDDEDQIYIPDNLSKLRLLAESHDLPVTYLSFTNDIQHADGSAAQKDTELLKRLWADESRTEKTADDIIAAARAMDADGIEIDFENIKESELWVGYARFLRVLWEKARAEGLLMRVVLGVSAPVDEMELPEGPGYSVMCYNLYGTHSGPGPKADAAFLGKTAGKFSALQNVAYALATGGFEWDEGSKATRSLTQETAEALLREFEATPHRDTESQALYFRYQVNGEEFTVWYADAQTLAAWRAAILEADPGAVFDLWRIGGNRWENN